MQPRTIPSKNNKKTKLAVLSAQSFRRRNDGVRPYNPKVVAVSLVSLFFVYLLYDKRSAWLPFFNKDKIQQSTLRLLENLQPNDDDDDTHFYNNPLLLYTTGMMLWEAVGLSTIPVETAAGMAFGWKAARYSLAGKLLGAFLAFAVGRFVLAGSSSRLLANNPTFQQLVCAEKNDTKRRTTKSHHPPLLTAFLIKFSVFPETIKNVIPEDCPKPLGKHVTLSHYVDANLYHDMLSGHSVTGILHFVNKCPIDWYSKKQGTVETATFGSEANAARTATEQIIGSSVEGIQLHVWRQQDCR